MTDRGTQFTGALAIQLTSLMGIEKLHTTAYHPQTNGVLERLHATLEAMLGKARALGLDWVGQIPFVLFALREAPNRTTTGFSPFKLVYGQHVRTPLDVIYEGWRGKVGKGLGLGAWTEDLCNRFEVNWLRVQRGQFTMIKGKVSVFYVRERKFCVEYLGW